MSPLLQYSWVVYLSPYICAFVRDNQSKCQANGLNPIGSNGLRACPIAFDPTKIDYEMIRVDANIFMSALLWLLRQKNRHWSNWLDLARTKSDAESAFYGMNVPIILGVGQYCKALIWAGAHCSHFVLDRLGSPFIEFMVHFLMIAQISTATTT